MLLNKFKSNHTFNFILFPLLGVLFWLKNLLYPQPYPFYEGETDNLLYSPVQNLLDDSVFLQNIIALILFLVIAFIILQINTKYNLVRIRTMLPASLFVILAGGVTGIHALHPVYFGAVFFLFALYRLLSVYDQAKPHSAVFDTGFFLGISLLFYLGLVVLLPAVVIGTATLSRETKWREFAILLTGFMLPLIFSVSYAFYTDSIPQLLKNSYSNFYTPNDFFSNNLGLQVYTGFLLFLIFLGSIKIIRDYDTKKVSIRKFFIVFFMIFLCNVAGIIIIPAISQEMLLIAAVPVTFLITNFFMFLKSRFWGEFIFLLLLLFVVTLQIGS